MALTFEWDARKAAANLAKHHVSFDEALSVFADPLGRLEEDDAIQFRSPGSYF